MAHSRSGDRLRRRRAGTGLYGICLAACSRAALRRERMPRTADSYCFWLGHLGNRPRLASLGLAKTDPVQDFDGTVRDRAQRAVDIDPRSLLDSLGNVFGRYGHE